MIEINGLTLNRDMLRLMTDMETGIIYRTEGGKDVRRARSFNNPIGYAGTRLREAGLAEIRADAKWRLTDLGRTAKADAEAAYEQRSVDSRAAVKAQAGASTAAPYPYDDGAPQDRSALAGTESSDETKIHTPVGPAGVKPTTGRIMADIEPESEPTPRGTVIKTYDDLRVLLRTTRKGRGVSCSKLAEMLGGRAPSLISLREGGQRIVPGDALVETFAALGKRIMVIDAPVTPTEEVTPAER